MGPSKLQQQANGNLHKWPTWLYVQSSDNQQIVLYRRSYLIVPGRTLRRTFHSVSKQNSTEAAHFQCLRHHNLP